MRILEEYFQKLFDIDKNIWDMIEFVENVIFILVVLGVLMYICKIKYMEVVCFVRYVYVLIVVVKLV